MLKHIIIVHRLTALRKALIFNEQFPNDKRAGLIKASNYISCRKKKEEKKKKKKALRRRRKEIPKS